MAVIWTDEYQECPKCGNELGSNEAYCETCAAYIDAQTSDQQQPRRIRRKPKMEAKVEAPAKNYVITIKIKAKEILNNLDGTYSIAVYGRELNPEDHKVLTRLYPHTANIAYHLLNVEALINSTVME